MAKSRLEIVPPPEHESLLNKVEILHTEEISGNLVAMVPVELVYMQDVPVDASHVMDLAESIKKEAELKGGHGQLSPVLLAEIPGFDQFPIVDGFHRTPAVQSLGRKEVYATIRPNSTWEDVIDHRILAATTHRSVRFSRVVEWVEESWRRGPWANRIGSITAFSLTFSKTMNGKNLGLSAEEVEGIKDWVNQKCEFWHLSPFTIYNNLNIARTAAPELVHEARERKAGHQLLALTPQHLSAVTKIFPNNFEMQKLIADVAKKHAMTVPKTRAAAMVLKGASDLEEAKQLVEETNWEEVQPLLADRTKIRSESYVSPLEHVANVEYMFARFSEVVRSLGITAIKGLENNANGAENIPELVKRMRLLGHKLLDLAGQVEARVKAKEAPGQAVLVTKAETLTQQNKKIKPTSEQQRVEKFEGYLVDFIENGGPLPYIANGKIEVARSVLRRLSSHKGLNKNKDLADRYIEVELAVKRAEQRLQKASSTK